MRRAPPAVRLLAVLGPALALGAGAVLGDDPAPNSAPGTAVTTVEVSGDPDGAAARADREAFALLHPETLPREDASPLGGPARPSDPVAAASRWMDLAEADPPALLPAPPEARAGPDAGRGVPLWPVREVAFSRLAALPEAGLAAVEARWGEKAKAALHAAVAAHDEVALSRVARTWAPTAAGSSAVLLLAEARFDRGDDRAAANGFERWLRLRGPQASDAARATVALRLMDALASADDERGVEDVLVRHPTLARVPLSGVGAGTDLAAHAAAAKAEIRARRLVRAAAPPPPPQVPARPAVVWTRPLSAEAQAPSWESPLLTVGLASSGDALYVAEERTVARLDVETGRVRWTYPRGPLPRDFPQAERYASHRLPVRGVAAGGGLVLTVLGDPPAAANTFFWWRDRWILPSEFGRETASRLVALDAETGEPRWVAPSPRSAHPVLGLPDVGAASPPTIANDRVWVLLSAARADVESWLACFDLATGAPRYVTPLARGRSGLDPPTSERFRDLKESHARTFPPGQAPRVAGDEVCVVTGAGYAAGVSAEDGRMRWVRALPSFPPVYDEDDGVRSPRRPPRPERCHSQRDGPVAVGGQWIVTAPDSPAVCAIESGTGRLRWVSLPPDETRGALGERVYGVGEGTDGRAFLRAADSGHGFGGYKEIDLDTGATRARDPDRGADPVASALTEDVRPWAEAGGFAGFSGAFLAGRWPAIEGPWGRPTSVADAVPAAWDLRGGEVFRAGSARGNDVWIAVTATQVLAIADESVLSPERGRDAADAAMRACRAAFATPTLASVRAAFEAARTAPEPAVLDALGDAVERLLPRPGPGPRALGPQEYVAVMEIADVLPAPARGRTLARIGEELSVLDAHGELLEAMRRALAMDDPPLVEAGGPGVRTRVDLLAATVWRSAAGRSAAGRAALATFDEEAERAMAEALGRGEDDARRALTRFAGTPAAWAARMTLLARFVDGGRWREAAAVLSDLRLWSSPDDPLPLVAAASLRAAEAEALDRAGERAAARAALHDVAAGVSRAIPALSVARAGPLADDWRAGSDLVPEIEGRKSHSLASLLPDMQPGDEAAVAILEPTGPGAEGEHDVALLTRGDAVIALSLEPPHGVVTTQFPTGFLGVRVLDREPSLPPPGVVLSTVRPGHPADAAGLLVGDWILEWGGEDVRDTAAFLGFLSRCRAGVPVEVATRRNGVERIVRVVPTERPVEEESPMRARSAWFDGRGHAVVPTRHGLVRIHLATGTAARVGTESAPGDWVSATLFAGRAYVASQAGAATAPALSAVDLATGRTLWRVALDGTLPKGREPWVLGSAVVVDLEDPDRTWLFDAETGVARGSVARYAPIMLAEKQREMPIAPSVAATGLLFAFGPTNAAGAPSILALSPASGALAGSYDAGRSPGARLYPPLLAGGSIVAAAVDSESMPVWLPDLRPGVRPAGPVVLDRMRWDYNGKFGSLDRDSRLEAHGDSVLLLRSAGNGAVSVCAFEIDRTRLGHAERGDPVLFHPPRYLLPATVEPGVTATPVLLAMRAGLDSAWVTAAFATQARGPSVEGKASWFDLSPADAFAQTPARATFDVDVGPPARILEGPVRVGRRLLVPVDGGWLVVPLRPRSR